MRKILINNKAEMISLAREIANNSKIGDVFGLKGTLGAGKSFFAQAFINAISAKDQEVLSPTFNLVYDYDTKKGEVFHFDLYRLKSADELENIGFFDALQSGISFIEWPEVAAGFLKRNYVEIEIKVIKSSGLKDFGEEVREIIIND